MEEKKTISFTDSFNMDHDLLRFFCFKKFFCEFVEHFSLRSHTKKARQIIFSIGINQQRQSTLLKSGRSGSVKNFVDINLIARLSI